VQAREEAAQSPQASPSPKTPPADPPAAAAAAADGGDDFSAAHPTAAQRLAAALSAVLTARPAESSDHTPVDAQTMCARTNWGGPVCVRGCAGARKDAGLREGVWCVGFGLWRPLACGKLAQ